MKRKSSGEIYTFCEKCFRKIAGIEDNRYFIKRRICYMCYHKEESIRIKYNYID